MSNKPATIKEIARRLNISPSTVSRALHNSPRIGLRTKMQVQALAKELNYEPNQAAISFQQGKTNTIGVILPRFSEEFFSLAISGIEDFASKSKYNVLIGQSFDDMEREQKIVETMKNNRVEGIIVSVAKNTQSYEHFDQLKRYNIPVVFFDCVPDEPGIYSISCNLHTGMVEGIGFLVKQGHSRIALLNGPVQVQASHQREAAYREGLHNNKLPVSEDLMVKTDLTKEGTIKAIKQLLQVSDPPTAIVAFHDYIALEAMKYLRSEYPDWYKKISFVSFAHLPLTSYLDHPPIASVEQFPYEQGYQAMELLYNVLQKKEIGPKDMRVVLESELVTIGK